MERRATIAVKSSNLLSQESGPSRDERGETPPNETSWSSSDEERQTGEESVIFLPKRVVDTRRSGEKKQNKNVKKKKEHKCEAVPAGTAVRGHGVNDRKPVSERARIQGAGEDVSRM